MATEEKNTMDVVSSGSDTCSSMNVSKSEVLRQVTADYLSTIDVNNPPSPAQIEGDILAETKVRYDLENAIRGKGDKWRVPQELTPAQIADIILKLYHVANVTSSRENADSAYDILSIYQDDGPNKGIYVNDDEEFNKLVRQFNYDISQKGVEEVRAIVKTYAQRLKPCIEKNLVAVNNGIFDYDTKQLLPFTPDKVFISKSKVDYNPNAKNVVIHNDTDGTDWDVESWMQSLSDDKDVVNTLWEVLGAIIRPNVPWGRSAWFYSEKGNNGKGTLCELMRELCGDGSYASIPLSEMGKDFMLEPLIRASAIIVDENDVGTYIDKAANLKSIITNDVLQINRKFKTPIAYRFRGFMVQCLNEMPKIKDKSDSFYRRQLFIPFEKCFTGVERKYIKNDYLHRKEVLEYVLYKVLNMNYYDLSTPDACTAALEEYKEFNDPIRSFLAEIMPLLVWKLIPLKFLYDLYRAWYARNVGNTGIQGRNTFLKDVKNLLYLYPEWQFETDFKVANRMDDPEPLIAEYQLDDWKNKLYTGRDEDKICTVNPLPKKYTNCFVRLNS